MPVVGDLIGGDKAGNLHYASRHYSEWVVSFDSGHSNFFAAPAYAVAAGSADAEDIVFEHLVPKDYHCRMDDQRLRSLG